VRWILHTMIFTAGYKNKEAPLFELPNDNAGIIRKCDYHFIIIIILLIYNFSNIRGSNSAKTVETGIMSDVNFGIGQCDTSFGAISDGINFTVYNRLFVIVSNSGDVWCSGNESIVSHRDETTIFNNNGTNFKSLTRTALGSNKSNRHKIVIPVKSFCICFDEIIDL